MKARVYGKRARVIPGANSALFAQSSPCKAPRSSSGDGVLTEISNNVPRSPKEKSKPRGKVVAGEEKRIGYVVSTNKVAGDGGHVEAVQSSSKIANVEVSVSAVEPEEIISTLERLTIDEREDGATARGPALEDDGGAVESVETPKTAPPCEDVPKVVPKIVQRPVQLEEGTTKYVDPLLQCKNVSKCVEDFQGWMDQRSLLLSIEKIGEGSFGEVYRATGAETVILKLMPLNARKGPGSRSYTSIESASNEIQLLERMQKIPGFVEFRGACVLHGTMPVQLVGLWNDYLESGRTVESKDPNKKGTYPSSQLWLLIEMSDAGKNLNPRQYLPPGMQCASATAKYLSVKRTWDIFWQVVRTLAQAEVYSGFEHRDLHLGNICVKDTSEEPDKENLMFMSSTELIPFSLNNTGVEATLIDYSLSRACVGGDEVLSYDIVKDKALLKGEGDLQYDIYRYMAEILGIKGHKNYTPKTNVLWLWYLLNRLLSATLPLSEDARKICNGKITAAARMLQILENLQVAINPKVMSHWTMLSAGDVLGTALSSGWLFPEEA